MKRIYDKVFSVLNETELEDNNERADDITQMLINEMRAELKQTLTGLNSLDDSDLRTQIKGLINKL